MKFTKVEMDAVISPWIDSVIEQIHQISPNVRNQTQILQELADFLGRKKITLAFANEEQLRKWQKETSNLITAAIEKKLKENPEIAEDYRRQMIRNDLETQLINEIRCRLIHLSGTRSTKCILAILAAGAGIALLWKAWETIKDGEEPEEAIARTREAEEEIPTNHRG